MDSAGVTLDIGFNNLSFSDRTLLLQIIGEAHSDAVDITLSPVEVKAIHVDSLILAAKSPFFHKLFSDGMQESEQKHVTLQIKGLEEISFMNLLKYIYSNNLPTTFDALVDLSLAADKFEVDSCLRDCTRALQKLPMTSKSASNYLDLPPNLLMSPTVQPLIDAAKKLIVEKFWCLDKCEEELHNLSLLGFQTVLSSDYLQVTSEYEVYECVLKWVRKHYSKLEERRDVLKTHLLHLVRFPFMNTTQLTKQVLTCNDIDPELASKIVIHALSFKAESDSSRKRCIVSEEGSFAAHQFVERDYMDRLVKVVEFESLQQCVVYLDLTKNKLNDMFPKDAIWSETFHLGGQELGLSCNFGEDTSSNQHSFWLNLDVSESLTCPVTIKYEFAVRRKPLKSFQSWFKGMHTFNVGESWKSLHGEEWTRFIGDDSSYFINDVLHVRAELAIKEI